MEKNWLDHFKTFSMENYLNKKTTKEKNSYSKNLIKIFQSNKVLKLKSKNLKCRNLRKYKLFKRYIIAYIRI